MGASRLDGSRSYPRRPPLCKNGGSKAQRLDRCTTFSGSGTSYYECDFNLDWVELLALCEKQAYELKRAVDEVPRAGQMTSSGTRSDG